jgi:hypothetical protein
MQVALVEKTEKVDQLPELATDEWLFDGRGWPESLMAATFLVDSSKRYTVVVTGFGKNDWYWDIDYELCIFLEYLPELHRQLQYGAVDVTVEIWAQGNACAIRFVGSRSEQVSVTCVSFPDSGPRFVAEPAIDICSLDDLIRMVEKLATDFVAAVDALGIQQEIAALRKIAVCDGASETNPQ